MSRVEENKIIFDQWKNLTLNGKPDIVNINLKIAEINVLMDISKSLAILADCCLTEWQTNNPEMEGYSNGK